SSTKVALSTQDAETRPTSSVIPIDKDFRQDLFVAPNGNTLYIEPCFRAPEATGITSIDEPTDIPLSTVVLDSASYIIACPQEHGATTLARRLVSEFRVLNKRVFLCDATDLPNYKKKLEEVFSNNGFKTETNKDAILILDNFDAVTHERL